jgi:tetratricopeptide (TPR) repeat protein
MWLPRRKNLFLVLISLYASFAVGCFPSKKLTVASVGMILEDVVRASAKQTDPSLVKKGTPAYLMLLDGLIEAYPKERRLLLAGAEAYCSYAGAFSDEGNPEAAGRLYLKGKEYALRAMSNQQEFTVVLSQPFARLEETVGDFSKTDVPVLFWFAGCWAGWISVTSDSVEAVADLPRVVLLMERLLELDETYHYGGAHIFMGVYKSAKPKAYGGQPEEARRHFERALEIGNGDFLMAYVYFADAYARKTFQKDLFVSLLEKVREAPVDNVPELTLINTVAKDRANELLNQVEELF